MAGLWNQSSVLFMARRSIHSSLFRSTRPNYIIFSGSVPGMHMFGRLCLPPVSAQSLGKHF